MPLHIDLSPLRDLRNFRLLFVSGGITGLGSMMTYVAIPFQMAQITDSFVAVGFIGLAELAPLIIFGLFGGSLSDRLDRRRMVVLTEIALLLTSVVLLVNALSPTPSTAVLYLVAMTVAALDGLQRPSLDAILPRVVPHDRLSAASALKSGVRDSSALVGPAIAGLLIAAFGTASVYAVDVATFALSIGLLVRLPPIPPSHDHDGASVVAHIGDGLRYARSRRDILGTYAVDLVAMTFAFPYALFPFVVKEYNAPWALGLLYSAAAVGSLVFAATSGWTPRARHHGRFIVFAAATWGAAVGLVAVAPTIGVVLALLVVAGYFDMLSGHFRGLMWNQTIPDEVRGRMAGLELISYAVGPTLGQARAGFAANRLGLAGAFASGGILCVAGVGIAAAALPALWRYDARTDPHFAAVKAEREHQARGEAS